MKIGVILGVVGILLLAGAVVFVAKVFIGAPSVTGKVIAESTGEVVMKNGVQEILLQYKKYPEGYKFNYFPEVIEVKKDIPVRIIGDDSLQGCYTSFNIPKLEIKHSFLKERVLEFTPTKAGEFTFSCTMAMGGGKLIVK